MTEQTPRVEQIRPRTSPVQAVADRMLIQVARVDVPTIADKVKPLFEATAARSGGRLSVEYLLDSLKTGASQLWLGVADDHIETALVAYVKTYPSGLKVCQILVLAGARPDLWLRCEPVIEQWARQRGCARIEALARPGWERAARHYRKCYVMLERSLTDGPS